MEQALEILKHPFTLGLLLGLLFFGIAAYHLIKTKMELGRFRRHLADKLELEARNLETLKKDKEKLSKENENLRIKQAQHAEQPDQKLERQLEILARAERQMNLNAPGFAAAWETAKSTALAEIQEEERGNTIPKKLFRKFFGSGETKQISDASATGSAAAGETGEPSSTEGKATSA